MSRKGMLEGIRVIDASTMLAAPLVTNLLGDFGAEVIKIEQPGVGDNIRYGSSENTWKVTSRNKKSITLNLRKREGKLLFYDLVKKSDVVVTNFRPETIKGWGIDYDDLVKIKESVVMLHLSAFGRNGPYKEKPGFARVAESFSGLTNMTGYPDRKPVFSGYPIADAMGGVYGAFSAMLAIYHYMKTGEGQLVDLSLYEPLIRVMENYIVDYDIDGKLNEREGTHNPGVAPNNIFETKDNKLLVIPASTQNIFNRFMKAIGHPELIDDPRFTTNKLRVENRIELESYINDFFMRHNLKELSDILEQYEVAYSWINSAKELFDDPHIAARNNLIDIYDQDLDQEIKMQGIVPKFSKRPGKVKWTGPMLGEHNVEVYKDLLALSEDKIEELKNSKII